MVKKDKFYVTTPIYYPNDEPHVGSAYTTIAADILARWHRLLGEEVFFLTGTDEHGQKIAESAQKAGLTPQAFVDKMTAKFKEAFSMLNISNNNFIRTTDKNHELEVKRILQELYDKKFIYKGHYEAHYCVACEQYLTASELVNNKCPRHPNREPELRKEETYMFKLSSFGKKLKALISKGELKIMPEVRRKEILNFLDEGLQDISISRLKSKVSWGVELPFDKNHTCYVWVDAFWNYISGLGDKKNFDKFWPVDVQLMAKDIIRVHATIWPALLLALGYELPKTLFVHGYFTINGMKMSKSLGNVISPIDLVNKYGSDSVRYYVMRNIPFGSDGDVSEKGLVSRHNGELANKFGNLVSRVSALAEKCEVDNNIDVDLENIKEEFTLFMNEFKFDQALGTAFSFIDTLNQWVQDKKIWETGNGKDLYELESGIRLVTILLWSFMPQTCEKIAETFGFNISLKDLDSKLKINKKVKKSSILFEKVEFKEEELKFSGKKVIVSKSMKDLSCSIAEIKGVSVVNKNSSLERMKKEAFQSLSFDNVKKTIRSYDYLLGDKDKGSEGLSSENLWNYVIKNKKLPNINTLTDAYNLMSFKTGLIMGAYDTRKVSADINIRESDGSENFVPIGSSDKNPVKIHKGEYLVVDDSNKVITRWLTKQHDDVAVNKSTNGVIVCIQGNKDIKKSDVDEVMIDTCKLITSICGGEFKILY